jgi:hypothetical protein
VVDVELGTTTAALPAERRDVLQTGLVRHVRSPSVSARRPGTAAEARC